MSSQSDKVKALGYEVAGVSEAPKAEDGTDRDGFWTVYSVQGFGLDLLVREDDDDVWASLLDKDAHAERVKQDGETVEEVYERREAAERERLTAEGKPLGALEVPDGPA